MSELPQGWTTAAIGEICSQGEQRVPETDERFTYIDIASIDRSRKTISKPQVLLGSDAPSRARKAVFTGDIIVSMTRPKLNAVALVGEQHNAAIASTGFDVLRPAGIEPRWIYSAVKSTLFSDAMTAKVQGALYPAIKSSDIRNYEIPLPPLAEQKRIAQKLDALLDQVDTLKARIDAIPALLKRFRRSVLASAIDGSLTGTSLKSTTDLSNTGEVTGGITKNAKRISFELSVPYLRVANVQAGYFDLEDVSTIGVTPQEVKKTTLVPGDILIVEGNGSLEHIGRAAVWQGQIDGCCHQNHLIRWRSNGAFLSGFVMIYLTSPRGRADLIRVAKSTAGLHTLSINKVSLLRIPVARRDQQQDIVRRVEQLFTFADQLEAKVAAAQKHIDALTQSLLAKAFRGELVPQDPNDEPASVLLERIRAQRAATPKPKRGRKAAAR